MTKKISQDFRRTEIRLLGALAKLDEFLLNLNSQFLVQSGNVPGISRDTSARNQELTMSVPNLTPILNWLKNPSTVLHRCDGVEGFSTPSDTNQHLKDLVLKIKPTIEEKEYLL